jgi:hypothetical protein
MSVKKQNSEILEIGIFYEGNVRFNGYDRTHIVVNSVSGNIYNVSKSKTKGMYECSIHQNVNPATLGLNENKPFVPFFREYLRRRDDIFILKNGDKTFLANA